MANIKIFISCHKKCKVLRNKYVMPVQVGTALAKKKFDEMYHDDEGTNISSLNPMYCELTAQYWAWKNVKADYYGFMHYRRYFSLSSALLPEDQYGNIVFDDINTESIEQLGLDEKNIEKIVPQYDIITLIPNDMDKLGSDTVYNHARDNSPYHRIEDMDEILKIISQKYPEYFETAKRYMSSTKGYFCNMYILKKDIFNEYCSWLFDILETHRQNKDFFDYSIDELRVSGFWAERLWGIFLTYLKENRANLKYKEVQKTFFKNTDLTEKCKPAFNENNIPIVFAADNNYVPILAVAMKSVVYNATPRYNYDLIVLHQNIDNDNQTRLKSELCKENISVRFINVADIFREKKLITPAHFTVEIYFRLAMQDIMANYDKVIYLDSDLIVNDDIAKLFFEPIGENYVGAVQDVDSAGCYKGFDSDRKKYFEKILKMKNPYAYFNSGVLVMNLNKFREKFTSEYILTLAESEKFIFPDQDVLNILCEGHVYYLDESWNTLMNHKNSENSRIAVAKLAPHQIYSNYLKARTHPKIIHFAGYQKPWEYSVCDMSEYFWKIARTTFFWEQLLLKLSLSEEKRSLVWSQGKDIGIQEKMDYDGVQIEGLDDPLYIDGIMVQFIKKVNKLFPLGSKRRNCIKKIAGIFIK